MYKKYLAPTIIALLMSLALILPFSLFHTTAKAAGETVYIYQDIATDTTWSGENTYVICEGAGQKNPKVLPGVTLTIESGARIELDANRSYISGGLNTYTTGILEVQGSINATGAIFTARTDKWKYIELKAGEAANSTVTATFTGCIFEKGGYTEPTGMIMVKENVSFDAQTVNLTVSGCTFRDSWDNQTYGIKGMGIYSSLGHFKNASGTFSFSNTIFSNLGGAIFVERNAEDEIDLSVDNCTFENVHSAVNAESCRDVTVTNSQFSNIGNPAGTGTPLAVGRNYGAGDKAKGHVTITGNTFTGTSGTTAYPMSFHASTKINAGIAAPGNTFPGYPEAMKYAYLYTGGYNVDAVWGKTNLPYLINGNVSTGTASGSLTIDPGVTVTMTGGGQIRVYTSFNAAGTVANPVRFNAVAPKSESNYILLADTKTDVTMKYCILDGMQYGVYGGADNEDSSNSLTIENCTFKNMAKTGFVYVDNGDIAEGNGVVKDSVFENNGEHGFYAAGTPNRLVFSNCIFRNNAKNGINLIRVAHMKFDHCLIYSNGQNGVMLEDNTDAANAPTLLNCTIAKNNRYGIFNNHAYGYLPSYTFAYGVILRNSIASENGVCDLYNQGYVNWSEPRVFYSCVTTSWNDYNETITPLGTGSIRKDALFADAANGDFHLKSDGGRWNGTGWSTDSAASQCIDAGDPASSYANEPAPNGGRINMGYYGNTAQASKARVGALDDSAPVWPEGSELNPGSITSSSATLSWNAVSGAVRYRIFKDEIGYGYGFWSTVKTVTGTSCSITGDFDWGYIYKVEAMDAAGNWSADGPQSYVRTPDTDPPEWEDGGSLTASSITSTSIRLNWSGAFDARGNVNKCRIYKDSTLLAETSYYNRPYTVTGLSPATAYVFKVEACDSSMNWTTDGPSVNVTTIGDAAAHTVTFNSQGGSAVASKTAQPYTTITAPANPTRSGYTFGGWYKEADCVNAWNFATDKVTSDMTLYAKWTSNKFVIAASVNNTGYGSVTGAGSYAVGTVAALKAVPKPGYRFVRWLDGSVAVSASAEYKFTVDKNRTLKAEFAAIGVPALKATATGYNSVKLIWGAITGAKEYEVYRAESVSGTYSRITTTAAANYTNTGLSTGKTYYYKVRAKCDANGTVTYGSYSSVQSAKPVPAVPAQVKAVSASYTSIKITWGAVPGATKYEVYRAASKGGAYAKVSEGTATSYTNTKLTTGKTYYYKVRAYRLSGKTKVYGDYSSIVSSKPVPAKPASVKAVRASSSSIMISWGKVPGATKYEVYRAMSKNGAYAKAAEGTAASFTHKKLTAGTVYYYKVRAYCTVGKTKVYGPFSAIVYAKP